MKEKFTPGPWGADCDCFPIMVRAEKMEPDCHQDWVCNVGGDRANARLIAAAPDMYEALQSVLDDVQFMIEDGYIGDIMDDILYVKARAALAKADGTP